MVLLGVLLVLVLVVVFFVGVWEILLVVFLPSLIFRLFWLLNFIGLYMPLKKLKKLVLLLYGLSVILSWFVLHLQLGLIFLWFFVIGGTFVLINVRKLGLEFLTFFVKEMHVLISLLTYGLFIREQFHWYNKLSSSFFLEFFINRYKLPEYRLLLDF